MLFWKFAKAIMLMISVSEFAIFVNPSFDVQNNLAETIANHR